MGEIVLETLLASNIETITDLNLRGNLSWFNHPITKEERTSNVNLLADLISKQAELQKLDLSVNYFSLNATKTIMTVIADTSGTVNKL